MLVNAARAGLFSTFITLGGGCGTAPATGNASQDSFAACPPVSVPLLGTRCFGVFRNYAMTCSEAPLLPNPGFSFGDRFAPFKDYLNCLWSDRGDLAAGLNLMQRQILEKIPEQDRGSAREAIFSQYPELRLEQTMSQRRNVRDRDPEPEFADLPTSDLSYVFNGWRYLKRGDTTPAMRWNLTAADPSKSQEYWDDRSKKWTAVKWPSCDSLAAARCNTRVVSGSSDDQSVDVKKVELGKSEGVFSVEYDNVLVPDNISIFYEGALLWSSGCTGFASQSGPIHYRGSSTTVEVQVAQNCDGDEGTFWEYKISCPR